MKVKITLLLLIFFFSCSQKTEPSIQNTTTLKKAEKYFTDIEWTKSDILLQKTLSEPYNIKDKITKNITKTIALYGDTNSQDNIFPNLNSLGIIDYSGIDKNLINFLINLSEKIKTKKIESSDCLKEKEFLPFLINYRLNNFDNISSIFFSRPEYKSNQKAISKFRCNFNIKENKKYQLIEITVIFLEDKWFIDSFDVIGEQHANTSIQN